MPAQIYHLIAFLMAAVVVLWTTPDVKNIGIKSGNVDKPGGRKVHERPMVRLGGVSIFAGTLTSLLIVWWLGGFGNLPPDIAGIPSGIAYAFGATSLLTYTSWRVWKRSQQK